MTCSYKVNCSSYSSWSDRNGKARSVNYIAPWNSLKAFLSVSGRFLAFWVRACAQFKIMSFFTRKTPPSTAIRDLVHNPVALAIISIFAFCCRVSHTTTDSGDEKSLASKLISKGKSWPKVAVGVKAMIFLCFWGKSCLVFWLLLRLTWSDCSRSGIIYKIVLCCIDLLSTKAFQGHLNWWRHKWNKTPAHSCAHTGTTGVSGLTVGKNSQHLRSSLLRLQRGMFTVLN